jgi:hypothetical protein
VTSSVHHWLIAFSRTAIQELRELPSHQRMAVFRVLRTLLRAENPLAVSQIKKLHGTAIDFVLVPGIIEYYSFWKWGQKYILNVSIRVHYK